MRSIHHQNHRRLQHLHSASQLLALTSPSISGYLSSRMTSIANQSGIQLAESTWRKTCACCGYALIPGWTATVRMRGLGEEKRGLRKEKKSKESPAEGLEPMEEEAKAEAKDEATTKKRKRGKRTRGKGPGSRARSSGELGTAETREDAKELSKGVTRGQFPPPAGGALKVKQGKVAPPSTEATSNPAAHKPKPPAGIKEPRAVYACKICNRKTVHALPIKPVVPPTPAPLATEQINVELTVPVAAPVAGMSNLQTQISTAKVQIPAIIAGAAAATATPEPQPRPESTLITSLNSTAKKRAKTRKNTLSEMLAKEKANKAAAQQSTGGFGFDLMDFMKTS